MSSLPKVWAHRGGTRWAPENTWPAFRASKAHGVFGIELDIRACRPNSGKRVGPEELVVTHDRELKRTTNCVGLVDDFTLSQLGKLSVGNTGEGIPPFLEVLQFVHGTMFLNVEVKPSDYPTNLSDIVVEALASYPFQDKLLVSSSDCLLLKRIHALAPDLRLAIIVKAKELLFDKLGRWTGLNRWQMNIAEIARAIGASAFHPRFAFAHPTLVADAQKANLAVNGWTLNDEISWAKAVKAGIDGVITDDPLGLQFYLDRTFPKQ